MPMMQWHAGSAPEGMVSWQSPWVLLCSIPVPYAFAACECSKSDPGPRVATAATGARYYSSPCLSTYVGILPQCRTVVFTGERAESMCATEDPKQCYIQIRVGGKAYWTPEHQCLQPTPEPAPFLPTTTSICAGGCSVFYACMLLSRVGSSCRHVTWDGGPSPVLLLCCISIPMEPLQTSGQRLPYWTMGGTCR